MRNDSLQGGRRSKLDEERANPARSKNGSVDGGSQCQLNFPDFPDSQATVPPLIVIIFSRARRTLAALSVTTKRQKCEMLLLLESRDTHIA